MSQRRPFTGSRRKLVLAIDIGTTYSGISFSVLDPGVVPEIKGVTRFPAQPPGGASKIPSVLYYDAAGVARAVGAETLLPSVLDKAEDELWFKVEWFKLHLRPKSDTSHHITKQIPASHRINPWSNGPDDQDRIHFVTEGEASLHFCVNTGLTIRESSLWTQGGGTRAYQEISSPECCFAGSIFVTEESRVYFEEKLRESRFHGDTTNFGGVRDREPALDIRSGQMKISGVDVARFFEPSISAILKAVIKQRSTSRRPITAVFLVGGFAASPEKLQQLGLSVHRPDTHVNKAVSDGAVSFFLDHFVTSRVSRSAFGIEGSIRFKHNNPEHRRRGHVYLLVDKAFCVILRKCQKNRSFGRHFFATHLTYYKTNFDVILLFGLTELKAQIAWKENVVYGQL
ncbi:hypothetical protein BT96DRAFT_921574 [Gymnopus androsaceus JB14]|uniref:Actin-like ATPase domain-containing protein n=1 Tax=Gymnopus androsaceus JB14 TaxID=1447944 RepID=A0A6A4HKK0_9AGAR|nr:hypothetical protein BT96DRAFT_921574 [Gymnopus androsaceus JB14]